MYPVKQLDGNAPSERVLKEQVGSTLIITYHVISFVIDNSTNKIKLKFVFELHKLEMCILELKIEAWFFIACGCDPFFLYLEVNMRDKLLYSLFKVFICII